MIPRGTPDIGWRDLGAGFLYCLQRHDASALQARVEARWSPDHHALACLSVRSGFDALLPILAFPRGSEVLISAVTIPDMVQILQQHGLVPVPIDIDPQTLAVDVDHLVPLIGPNTKAIVLAHLFGSRMPLDRILHVARQHGLFVIEDCAQAYDASRYRGHPQSDVSMFSFGPIKTETALGGALLHFRDQHLLAAVRRQQCQYPRQSQSAFARRVARFVVLKMLAHPFFFTLFVALCRVRNNDYNQMLNHAVRGFAGEQLFARLRHQPCAPLLRLLERRLRRANPQRIERRASFARNILAQLPLTAYPGSAARQHTHWVVPIASSDPETLVRLLRAHGFDATCNASRLTVAPAAQPDHDTPKARQMLEQIVYVPVSPHMSARATSHLCRIITDFERTRMRRT